MTTVSYTVDDTKLARYIAAIKYQYPNLEKNADGSAKYTDAQWAKEAIRRLVVEMVFTYDRNEARKANVDIIMKDDTLIS